MWTAHSTVLRLRTSAKVRQVASGQHAGQLADALDAVEVRAS